MYSSKNQVSQRKPDTIVTKEWTKSSWKPIDTKLQYKKQRNVLFPYWEKNILREFVFM